MNRYLEISKLGKIMTKVKFKALFAIVMSCLLYLISVNAIANDKGLGHHYVKLAHSMFSDALDAAKNLDDSINMFVADPSEDTHQNAKKHWIDAHSIYSQTEVFRFGNPNVDDWEGKVNAWPMDEGLLDYVENDYVFDQGNPHANENIIASNADINLEFVASMHEKSGSESNVASGYHAIEFLLWGQDLNTKKASSGTRMHTDYEQGDKCTNGACLRRAQYLKVVTKLLIQDLNEMVDEWLPGYGDYAKSFMQLPEQEQHNRMLLGLGGLGFGELAAERIRVALIANSQEDEQSCFSDTTDLAILNNVIAISNVYQGIYRSSQGVVIEGPSLADLVQNKNANLNQVLIEQLNASINTARQVSELARNGEHFDLQILSDNEAGNQRLMKLIDQLRQQTQTIETISDLVANNS